MNSFFPSLVIELDNRCGKIIFLLEKLSIPDEIEPNLRSTIIKSKAIKKDLQSILNDPDFGASQLLLNHITDYKRCYEDYSLLEKLQLPILLRYSKEDSFFHALLKTSLSQVNFDIETPLISATSINYYGVYNDKNPVLASFFVPVVDDIFLLNLPDLFHEIGHLLFFYREKELSNDFITSFDTHILNEKHRMKVEIRPFDPEFYETLEDLWKDWWIKEHAANMIATYCLGPSFGWQCLRICANTGEDVYFPAKINIESDDHPSFESQIQGILEILKIMGMNSESLILNEKWKHYKSICHFNRPTEHQHCYPDHLIKSLAENVFDGCTKIGLKSFVSQKHIKDVINIPLLLNESWNIFQADPNKFLIWEDDAVKGLKISLCEKS
jgi:hypothetical protein